MLVHSTRSNERIDILEAINKGIATDGGLFVFDEVTKLDITTLTPLNYHDLTLKVLENYLDITPIKNSDYLAFPIKVKSFENYSYMELFHGPTAAFKDVALTFLPYYLKKAHVLVATSGDTGSAALSGFSSNPNIDVTVLYPNNKVSPLQEKQMLYFSNERNKALAYDGNFDDCQKLVKEIALKNPNISSANSINIGRLLPQIVYYFYGYLELVRNNKIKLLDEIDVCVPTGNFGNILACYLAKQMGVPIHTIICATNENKVLCDFINTGIYDSNREFIKTDSPSMDILVSSNIERLLYFYYKDCNKVKILYEEFKKTGKMVISEYKDLFKDFASFYVTNEEALETIKKEKKNNDYLIDPHTAVAKKAIEKYDNKARHILIASTASPYKFSGALAKVNINLDYNKAPDVISKALACNLKKSVVSKEEVEALMYEKN